ncbi:MAG TPA: hypothetical protein VJA21_13955, partial [Verrucomicrobiae bacterium]
MRLLFLSNSPARAGGYAACLSLAPLIFILNFSAAAAGDALAAERYQDRFVWIFGWGLGSDR